MTSHIFWKDIRLSLAILVDVDIHNTVQSSSMVTSQLVTAHTGVTTPLVAASIYAVAHNHDISVQPNANDVSPAFNTLTSLSIQVDADVITKWSVDRTTVSVLPVSALIAVCILVATLAIVTTPVKSIHSK